MSMLSRTGCLIATLSAVLLAGCGNKGPLVQAPAIIDEDAVLMQTPAVQAAGAGADPLPADQTQSPLPPFTRPTEEVATPVEETTERIPAPVPPTGDD